MPLTESAMLPDDTYRQRHVRRGVKGQRLPLCLPKLSLQKGLCPGVLALPTVLRVTHRVVAASDQRINAGRRRL